MSGERTIQVTPQEMAVIRGVLERVDALGRDDRALIDRVAIAILDGPDLGIGLSNDWDVIGHSWQWVQVEVAG